MRTNKALKRNVQRWKWVTQLTGAVGGKVNGWNARILFSSKILFWCFCLHSTTTFCRLQRPPLTLALLDLNPNKTHPWVRPNKSISCAEVQGGGRRDKSEEKKKVSQDMAATEFLVLTMFMSSAHSFCWKPNVNPFMGKNIVLIVTNFVVYLFSAHVCKVLLIPNGLTCQLWESAGTMSSLRAPLVKRSLYPYCVVANDWTIRFQMYMRHIFTKSRKN